MTSSSLIEGWKNSMTEYRSSDEFARTEPAELPKDESEDMTRLVTNRSFRDRRNRLRRTLQAFEADPDSQSGNRKNRLRAMEDAVALLLLDAPRITRATAKVIKQTVKSAEKLAKDIQKTIEQYQVANTKQEENRIQWGRADDFNQSQPQVTFADLQSPKGEYSRDPDRVSQNGRGGMDQERDESHAVNDEGDDDDDCTIIMVIDKRAQYQKSIEAAMELKDQLLWYDVSQHFNEAMLP